VIDYATIPTKSRIIHYTMYGPFVTQKQKATESSNLHMQSPTATATGHIILSHIKVIMVHNAQA